MLINLSRGRNVNRWFKGWFFFSITQVMGFRYLTNKYHNARGYRREVLQSTVAGNDEANQMLHQFSPYKRHFPEVNENQWSQLCRLCLSLKSWNLKVNMISRKDIDSIVPNHIVPSMSISLVNRFSAGDSVIDVGTGGGLPGLPMAILFPDTQFTLLDSNRKKMTIVQEIASSADLNLPNVRVVVSRAEDHLEKYDYMLGRAVSAVPSFLGFSSHLIRSPSNHASSAHDSPRKVLYEFNGLVHG